MPRTISDKLGKKANIQLEDLIFRRLRSRLWLMRETLTVVSEARCGESFTVNETSLEGIYYIVDDMFKEVCAAAEILDNPHLFKE